MEAVEQPCVTRAFPVFPMSQVFPQLYLRAGLSWKGLVTHPPYKSFFQYRVVEIVLLQKFSHVFDEP